MSEETYDTSPITSGRQVPESGIKQPPASTTLPNDQVEANEHISSEMENSPSIAAASPRELVNQAVSNFCSDTIVTASEQVLSPRSAAVNAEPNAAQTNIELAVVDSPNQTSSRKPAYQENSPQESTVEIIEIVPPKGSSPRELVEGVALHASKVVNTAIATAEVVLSPRQPQAASSSDGHMQVSPSPRGEKPAEKQKKPIEEQTIPAEEQKKPRGEQKKPAVEHTTPKKKGNNGGSGASEAEPLALAQAAAFLAEGDKLAAVEPKKRKKSRQESDAAAQPASSDQDSSKPRREKRNPATSSSSSAISSPTLPQIRRPSPPVQERNLRQNDNPRYRKLKADEKDAMSSSRDLPPISGHPLRDPTRNAKKGVRSSESIGVKNKQENGKKARRRVGSQSAPIPGEDELPPIRGGAIAEGLLSGDAEPEGGTPVRRRKKPLFLRLQDRAKKIEMQIEKEKMEMYRKVRLKRIKAQPTREEIEEHMLRYRQMKLEHIEQEKGYAEARKKDWRKKNGQLRKIGAGVASPQKHKVDFVEEQRLREKEEEEMRKMRIERGKEYGDAVRGGSDLPPSPRATDKLHSHVPPRGQSSEDPLHVDVTPSPDRHLPQHHYHTPTKHGHQHHRGVNAELDVVALVPNSPRSNKGSPRTTSANKKVKAAAPRRNEHSPKPPQAHHPSSSQAGSDKSPEKKETKARKFITHQSSAMEGDPGSPYDGKVGVDWVAEVMDVDGEEDNLAVVYETGFSMLMVEKGIINSGDLYDELLTDGMVVATPPVKGRLMPSSLMVTEATDSRDVH